MYLRVIFLLAACIYDVNRVFAQLPHKELIDVIAKLNWATRWTM